MTVDTNTPPADDRSLAERLTLPGEARHVLPQRQLPPVDPAVMAVDPILTLLDVAARLERIEQHLALAGQVEPPETLPPAPVADMVDRMAKDLRTALRQLGEPDRTGPADYSAPNLPWAHPGSIRANQAVAHLLTVKGHLGNLAVALGLPRPAEG